MMTSFRYTILPPYVEEMKAVKKSHAKAIDVKRRRDLLRFAMFGELWGQTECGCVVTHSMQSYVYWQRPRGIPF